MVRPVVEALVQPGQAALVQITLPWLKLKALARAFLQIPRGEFEPGAVLPPVVVVGAASGVEDGKRPGADAAETAPDVLGCERGRKLSPEG